MYKLFTYLHAVCSGVILHSCVVLFLLCGLKLYDGWSLSLVHYTWWLFFRISTIFLARIKGLTGGKKISPCSWSRSRSLMCLLYLQCSVVVKQIYDINWSSNLLLPSYHLQFFLNCFCKNMQDAVVLLLVIIQIVDSRPIVAGIFFFCYHWHITSTFSFF